LAEATEELPPELITGILLQRRRLLICGVSFGRKTWLCMQIAFCLSKGLLLFGKFKTTKIPVLYANLELLEASAKRRFRAIAKALKYEGDPFENLRIISSTEFTDIIENDFAEFLALQASDDKVKAVCIDPLWRLLGERDENSVTGIGQVLKPFAKFSREADASAIATHHFAKGNAAIKDPIDRASGSGALSRDAATQLTLSGHRELDAYTIDIATNDFVKPDKFCVQFNYPIFELAPDLDPTELKQPLTPVADIKKGVRQTETVLSVLYARDYQGGLRHTDIVRFTGFPKGTITKILKAETQPKGRIVKSQAVSAKRDVYLLSAAYRSQRDRGNAAKNGENDDFDPEMDTNEQN
jgi:AAA domain